MVIRAENHEDVIKFGEKVQKVNAEVLING